MSQAAKILGILLLIGGLTSGWGCRHAQIDQFPAPSWNPPLLAKPKITNRDQIFVHPGIQNLRLSRVGLFSFRGSPETPEANAAITRIFYRELLLRRPFTEVVLLPETFSTIEEARRLAQGHRLDVLLLGEIPYYLDGGMVGTAGIQVDLRVVDAKNGQILWCLTDSIKATRRPVIDLWVTETRPYPTPDMGALMTRLAARMVDTLEQGPPPPSPTGVKKVFSWK